MIALDEVIFSGLLKDIPLQGKTVADVGCGTGRNWPLILSAHPAKLSGYDVSAGMLQKLHRKFPEANTYQIADHTLPGAEDASVDLVVSTLALAHFSSLEETFEEWNRILKTGGDVVLTDYHPEALQHGATVTFMHGNTSVAIQHHIYSLETIKLLARFCGWAEINFTEYKIDEAVKHYYEQQHALRIYEKFRGKPIIYGIHFRKSA